MGDILSIIGKGKRMRTPAMANGHTNITSTITVQAFASARFLEDLTESFAVDGEEAAIAPQWLTILRKIDLERAAAAQRTGLPVELQHSERTRALVAVGKALEDLYCLARLEVGGELGEPFWSSWKSSAFPQALDKPLSQVATATKLFVDEPGLDAAGAPVTRFILSAEGAAIRAVMEDLVPPTVTWSRALGPVSEAA